MNNKPMNFYEFHIDLDTETDMSNLNGMLLRLDRIRRETAELENDIAKIRGELDKDMTPSLEDIGRWVEVRDRESDDWEGPKMLTGIVPQETNAFQADDRWWRYARLKPIVAKATMQAHDGSPNKPEWLSDDDELIVEYEHGVKAIRFASVPNWNRVRRYQKLEIK